MICFDNKVAANVRFLEGITWKYLGFTWGTAFSFKQLLTE